MVIDCVVMICEGGEDIDGEEGSGKKNLKRLLEEVEIGGNTGNG